MYVSRYMFTKKEIAPTYVLKTIFQVTIENIYIYIFKRKKKKKLSASLAMLWYFSYTTLSKICFIKDTYSRAYYTNMLLSMSIYCVYILHILCTVYCIMQVVTHFLYFYPISISSFQFSSLYTFNNVAWCSAYTTTIHSIILLICLPISAYTCTYLFMYKWTIFWYYGYYYFYILRLFVGSNGSIIIVVVVLV